MQKFNFARDSVGRGCIDLISEPISSFYCPMASLQLSRPVQMPERAELSDDIRGIQPTLLFLAPNF